MTATRPPITPTVDIPLSVAVEELRGFEVIAIQKHYGRDVGDLGAVMLTMGTVWAYSNRDDATMSWTAVENMDLRSLNGYFAAEPEDTDPDEPDTELGKG